MEIELKRLIKNSTINISGNAFSKICRYFIAFLVIKVLGVNGYGHFALAMSIITIGTIFSSLGMHYGVSRFIPIYLGKQEIDKIKGTIHFCGKVVIISSLVITVVIFISSNYLSNTLFNKPESYLFIKLLVFTIPFTVISTFVTNVFKGFNVIKYKVITEDVFVHLLRVILLFACMILGLKILGVIYSYILTGVSGVVVGLYFMIKKLPKLFDKSIKTICDKREIISYSFPLFLNSFVVVLLSRIDILMLSYYLPSDHVGMYSLANRMATLVFFISASIFAVFSPTIAEFYGKGERDLISTYYQKISRWALILTIPVFLFITIFSHELLKIFGLEFTGGKVPLIILATSFLLNSFFGFSGQLLSVVGRSKLIFINSFIVCIMNYLLNLVLIPKYGIVGAAIATGFSLFLLNTARMLEVYFLEHLSSLKLNLLGPISVGAISGIIIIYSKYLLQPHLHFIYTILLIGILVIVYLTLTLMIILNEEEISILKSLSKSSKHYLGG